MITSISTVESCRQPTLDSKEESPLEVLSRAATMVRQESQQAGLNDSTKQLHKQTTKCKRDKRRLPEYSRKSDPKVPETLGVEPSSPEASISNGNSPLSHSNLIKVKREVDLIPPGGDTPLDMTVKQRGEPPSYAQTISNPGYRSSFGTPKKNPSSAPSLPKNRDRIPSGISMCDTVIDEHFRRSLGQDYHAIFQNTNPVTEAKHSAKLPQQATTNVIEFMDDTALSVDDHFAKALGDTWKQLNKKEQIKKRQNESNLVLAKN
ncbi:transcription cofactor vestigial-like protein 4 isoform X1 [Dendroctonus ponderosae]|uniref:Transcription cofactor vestigial-like protein 4 n=1 Tax=Dendroctonus ponderosae TaxID=77166 RepID=J3JWX6_DENPD|nr:transcription cofactor vestigial-like protein 4 isoform X1 [Dendroctonus ponderosae]XP_048522335.1 transcription cofactor vestigial-like protein 4 isoform X1 [Dendroctonus ponderosae]AEE62706.1 unknown [Dendroctonus ponderosae]